MAKIKVRPRPGALSELLKTKGMTQMDASEKTRVDRKTLLKIDRGEEVKLETLQQVATKLQVTEGYFRHPPAAEVTDDSDVRGAGNHHAAQARRGAPGGTSSGSRTPRVAAERQGPGRRGAQVSGGIRNSRREVSEGLRRFGDSRPQTLSLRSQLERLKTADDIVARLERLAEHGLALLGADYLFWECSISNEDWEVTQLTWEAEYRSSNAVLLTIEPFGTQSRRAHIFAGDVPPTSPQPKGPQYI